MVGLLAVVGACSLNPATGRVQFALIKEDEEIRMGEQGDLEIREKIGVYEGSAELTELVNRVGQTIAKASERPALPWSFQILDDASVNAFALPGGFIYVTRGLLAHLSSEAELAAVLSHEVGHVTARHGAVSLRKNRTARRSVGFFRIIDPNLRHVGGIAARTATLALLRYSREDEHEADDLSLRYVQRAGYDVMAINEVFLVLAGLHEPTGAVPSWLSTHPEPSERRERMATQLGKPVHRTAPDARYLARIDGILHGEDPRDGYFVGLRFIHPRRALQFDLPAGWVGEHNDDHVQALSRDRKAMLVFAPTEYENARGATEEFFKIEGIVRSEGWEGGLGPVPMVSTPFSIATAGGEFSGLVAFIEYGDRIWAMLTFGPAQGWHLRTDALAVSFASFRPLQPGVASSVEPMRIHVTSLPNQTDMVTLAKTSVVGVEQLAALNHVMPDEVLPAGRLVKGVVGFNPAKAAGL